MTTGSTTLADGNDHWRWRPDWTPERACTFWYLTLPGETACPPDLRRYLDRLTAEPWLDVVPLRWWHVTLTEIGYAEALDDALLDSLAAEVGRVVAEHGPLRLELGPVVRFRTALALGAGPSEQLTELQARVREVTRSVLGPDFPVVHPKVFRPHVSLAYVNRDVPGAHLADLLAEAPEVRIATDVDRLTLAAVTRRDRHYQWRVRDEVELG
jgi:2'-5' RNA ligase